MDKSVFRAYETYWDDEVLLLLTQQARNSAEASDEIGADRVIRKSKFGKIFLRAWAKAPTPSSIIAGFKATGIYPVSYTHLDVYKRQSLDSVPP